jgi:hypothetical protein
LIDVVFTLVNGQRINNQFTDMAAWVEYMKTISKEEYSRIDVMEVICEDSNNN